MNKFTKAMTGAAAAALVAVTAVSPADARHRDNDGIDLGDVITGVAVIGGIAAIASAIGRDGDRYGYDSRYRNRDGYSAAVQACGYEAERHGRGRVSITDVDRRNNGYRVRGVIDGGGGYDDRYGRYDDRYGRYDRGDSYDRTAFTCTVRHNGRVTNFRVNDGYRW